jgi:coenzyme PQQ biosynthesis protein C
MTALLSGSEFEAALRGIGARKYHNLHPFHRRLHAGQCTMRQVQAWALNRYAYQARIPVKDAIIVSRLPTPALRRAWSTRLADHDGAKDGEGGIARWLTLTRAVGFDDAYVTSEAGLLPATRFAAEAYVQFVRERTVLEAVASSLTELFAPKIIGERVEGMLAGYDFISKDSLAYFTPRLTQAPRDADFALKFCIEHATTPDLQRVVLDALSFKCDVLWAMLDALEHAYVAPGHVPPGAWTP